MKECTLSNKVCTKTDTKCTLELRLSGKMNRKGSREEWNRQNLQAFLNLPGVAIQHTTTETTEIFSDIILALRKRGKPIPTNDI